MVVQRSSISNAGPTTRGKARRIEYLGNGGIMEIESNQKPKKLIDCLEQETLCVTDTLWYFGALYFDDIDADFFEQNTYIEVEDYGEILSWCLAVLGHSPSACLMLKEVCDKDWKVTLEDLRGSDYFIDVTEKLIIIDNHGLEPTAIAHSNYFRNILLVTLIKALRDVWQENRYGGFDELYSPEYILLMERVRAADLDVVGVMVGWELRSNDYTELWRHLIGSDTGDMAMTFSGYLERDPSAQFNGHGLVAAFKQWFRDTKRLDTCDHDCLEYLDDVLAINEIGEDPFGKKKPSKMNIEILSCLPDKSAYLQGQGAEILSNPVYTAVDNAINQAHLMHIMHDLEVCMVEDVPFRDAELARKIFPEEEEA